MSDFEVFYNLVERQGVWRDPHVRLEKIPELLGSGDVEVWPQHVFSSEAWGVSCVRTRIISGGEVIEERRQVAGLARDAGSVDYERQVFTLPVGLYEVMVAGYVARDCGDTPLFTVGREVDVRLGSDELWDPVPEDAERLESRGPLEAAFTAPATSGEAAP